MLGLNYNHLYVCAFSSTELPLVFHSLITLYYFQAKHRDVLQDGFGEDLNGKADAVFLDLPSPWLGVPHAVAAMKEEGKCVMYKIFCSIGTFKGVFLLY